ncbi:NirD/YgiW/YdeI family stress tolerance protein [Actinobacillus indolicus]|uniref:NirD/YgiW/YdeI family stress tolerance protein n=1 Tax=Actinobacillus indolicus TaxID=51049 RepID=A0A4V1AY74_9PAST|nr:NirD/YgiW/YdeI family stress tolerance protein [Actinobacillus indolicus]QBQ64380.1 NirD/YgiW/YdeI family stress tolerance protein [Actinobacillus indolicus]
MKKYLVLSTLVASVALVGCSNNNNTQQVFGANVPATTISVKQALSARDDSYVTVEGNIISQVDDDEYILADTSGQIRVEIDNHIWQGQNVSKNDKVRIYGEIDSELNKAELKARELTILK